MTALRNRAIGAGIGLRAPHIAAARPSAYRLSSPRRDTSAGPLRRALRHTPRVPPLRWLVDRIHRGCGCQPPVAHPPGDELDHF
jgi:hypothetical protein